MSTTVSYKGSTIATVENNTKTLTTQGYYLEANIVLTDVSTSIPDGDETGYGSLGARGTWYFNETPTVTNGDTYYINFTTNSTDETAIVTYRISSDQAIVYSNAGAVYGTGLFGNGWTNQAYRTITITGGQDVMNADLIAFLEATATKTA